MDRYKTDFSHMNFATRAVKFGEGPDPVTHALNTPRLRPMPTIRPMNMIR